MFFRIPLQLEADSDGWDWMIMPPLTKAREGIDKMDWQPKSPDMNPIEPVWDMIPIYILKHMINKKVKDDTILDNLEQHI